MSEFLASYLVYAKDILFSFLDPKQRVFYVYIAASVLAAFGVYLVQRKHRQGRPADRFCRFFCPSQSGPHPSAWLTCGTSFSTN